MVDDTVVADDTVVDDIVGLLMVDDTVVVDDIVGLLVVDDTDGFTCKDVMN